MPRYIFTVTAGRSGQASLTALLNRHVPGCLAMFEEPHVRPHLPGFGGDLERRFRRRFVETHELLGRGRVLAAFDEGEEAMLDRLAARRLRWIDRQVARRGARLYVDVSKYFARGLHRALARALPQAGLIRLVRDPILNMRSFLNRGRRFYLDNNRPDGPHNQVRLDPAELSPGELYLWAWCELYLRYDALVDEFGLSPAVEIRTEDLNDTRTMAAHFDALGFDHERVETIPRRNTNVGAGFGESAVAGQDIETFERFIARLPGATRERIAYLDGYDPRARHGKAA